MAVDTASSDKRPIRFTLSSFFRCALQVMLFERAGAYIQNGARQVGEKRRAMGAGVLERLDGRRGAFHPTDNPSGPYTRFLRCCGVDDRDGIEIEAEVVRLRLTFAFRGGLVANADEPSLRDSNRREVIGIAAGFFRIDG